MIMRDNTKSMWADALEMLEQADRLQRQFFQVSQARTRGPTWEPPADIFETDYAVVILVALPGVAPEDVDVDIQGCSLYITAERPTPAPPQARMLRMEIPYGRFERQIDLPSALYEIGEQTLINGCLLLTLRKLG
jgi:HSP20 family molecular chaperone IbpA